MDDKEIIRLFNEGQTDRAFGELVRSYSERLYWHVRRFVNSHDDTDDLLQDIFVKIWTSFPSFRGESQLYTWLYRIATNEAINYLKRKRVKAALTFENFDEMMDRRIDEDPYFNGDEAQRLLSKAVSRLPSRQKTVFCMRYYDELPYEQMSEILDTSVGALKASYHIAFEKVSAELKEKIPSID